MLDLIFTIGQAGCTLFLLYGACLVLTPARRTPDAALEDRLVLREHILYDV